MSTTGKIASRDAPVLDSLLHAVEQVNGAGGLLGRPLVLDVRDANSELNVAYTETLKLIEKQVPVIFATCDLYFSRPIMEVADNEGVMVIAPCGPEPRVGEVFVRPLAFSTGTSNENYGRVMAEFAADEGFGQVALFVEGDDPGADRTCGLFAERFAELGGSVERTFVFGPLWWDLVATSSSLRISEQLAEEADSPLVVMCAAPDGMGRRLFRLLRLAGAEAPILATSALDGKGWMSGISNVGPLYVVTEASIYGDDPSEQVNFYFAGSLDDPARSVERVGWAVTGAEGLWAFVRAVNSTESLDPADLATAIEGFNRTELWMGNVSYSPDSHVVNGRSLRIISHANEVSRLIQVRTPTVAG